MPDQDSGVQLEKDVTSSADHCTKYLAAKVDALVDRIASSEARESQLVATANTATNWFRGAVVIWTTVLVIILGLDAIKTAHFDDFVSESKNEIRQIAGTSKPSHVDWGRSVPGSSNAVVAHARIRKTSEGYAELSLTMFPEVEVFGAVAVMSGWHYTADGQLLDWITSTNEFSFEDPSGIRARTEEFRRSSYRLGTILWIGSSTDENVKLHLVPGIPWAGRMKISVEYRTCDQAMTALETLLAKSKSKNLSQIGLLPIIENYSSVEKEFSLEVVNGVSDEAECWEAEDSDGFDPIPEFSDI